MSFLEFRRSHHIVRFIEIANAISYDVSAQIKVQPKQMARELCQRSRHVAFQRDGDRCEALLRSSHRARPTLSEFWRASAKRRQYSNHYRYFFCNNFETTVTRGKIHVEYLKIFGFDIDEECKKCFYPFENIGITGAQ